MGECVEMTTLFSQEKLCEFGTKLHQLMNQIRISHGVAKAHTILIRMNKETQEPAIGVSNGSKKSVLPIYQYMYAWLLDHGLMDFLLCLKKDAFRRNPTKRMVMFYYNDREKVVECSYFRWFKTIQSPPMQGSQVQQ